MSNLYVVSIHPLESAATSADRVPKSLSPEAAQALRLAAERMRAAMREDEKRLPSGRGPLSFLGIRPHAS